MLFKPSFTHMKVCQDKPSVREELPSKPLVGMVCQVPKECAGAEKPNWETIFLIKLHEKEKLEAKLEFHVFKSMEPKHD